MKFTPEVVAALEVLRAAAENDFERHRLDVLEKDLREPPKVEILDDKHQRFNGKQYSTANPDKHLNTSVLLHRAVWEYFYGEIPKGFVIHHVDGNKHNNQIENLRCLSSEEHLHLHSPKGTRPLLPLVEKTCACCGQKFITEDNAAYRFCSEQCERKARYQAGSSHETRKCLVCGKEFTACKWNKRKYCSYKCAAIDNGGREIRTCPVCGQTFDVKRSKKQKTCSHSCAMKLIHSERRENIKG